MILLREAAHKVIQVPVLGLLALALCSTMLGLQLAGLLGDDDMKALATIVFFEAVAVFIVVSELHVIRRVDDELILRWALGTKRWQIVDSSLHAQVRGTRTVSLQLDLLSRNAEPFASGTPIATLPPNAKGWAQAESIAQVVGLSLSGERLGPD